MDIDALIATLKLRDGQLRDACTLINKTREDMFDLILAFKEIQDENAQLRHHLNPALGPEPITEDEAPY